MNFAAAWDGIKPGQIVYCFQHFHEKGVDEVRPFVCLNSPKMLGEIVMAIITKNLAKHYPYYANKAVLLVAKTCNLAFDSVALGDDVVPRDRAFAETAFNKTPKTAFRPTQDIVPQAEYNQLLDYVLASEMVKEKHRQAICFSNGRDYSPLFES